MRIKIINFLGKTKLGRLVLFAFSETFDQEFKESLAAKRIFHEQNKNRKNIFLLRRNVHRLEKGLCSKNRKAVFALGYIKPTVGNYAGFMSDETLKKGYKDDLAWAKQILSEYFRVVTLNDDLVETKDLFEKAIDDSAIESLDLVPYEFEKISNIPLIDYEQFQSMVFKRRSIRFYKEKPVADADIEKALELAKYSPSPCNRYSVRYHCISDKELIKKVGTIVGGAKTFIDNVPKLIAITSLSSAFEGLYDRHAAYIDASLSLMTFVYSLETLGLSSCVINWPKVPKNDREAREYLNLQDSENVIMLLSVGYADMKGMIPYSQKKSNKNLIKYYD